MANYSIVKDLMTVFVQDASTDSFDANLAKAVAIAQSYSLDENGDTQEIVDLADENSEYSFPEVVKQNWTLSVDSLLLRSNSSGTISVGANQILPQSSLSVGQIVWAVLGDASAYLPDSTNIAYRYGKCVITNINRSGNTTDPHTVSATFMGRGPLYTS